MKFPIRAALVAVALASPLSVVDAQTAQDQDHSAHHPTDKAATPGPRGSMRGAGRSRSLAPREHRRGSIAGREVLAASDGLRSC